jgi:hypothetical protein
MKVSNEWGSALGSRIERSLLGGRRSVGTRRRQCDVDRLAMSFVEGPMPARTGHWWTSGFEQATLRHDLSSQSSNEGRTAMGQMARRRPLGRLPGGFAGGHARGGADLRSGNWCSEYLPSSRAQPEGQGVLRHRRSETRSPDESGCCVRSAGDVLWLA